MIEGTIPVAAKEIPVKSPQLIIQPGYTAPDKTVHPAQITIRCQGDPTTDLLPAEEAAIQTIAVAAATRCGKFKEGTVKAVAKQVEP